MVGITSSRTLAFLFWEQCNCILVIFCTTYNLFIYLGFYVAFNTVQVISRRVVGRAEETSTYSSLGLCTVNCRPMASNYQLSHLRPSRGSNPGLRGGRRECYHSVTMAPVPLIRKVLNLGTCIILFSSITAEDSANWVVFLYVGLTA